MAITHLSIRVKDFGEYHNTIIKLYLKKDYQDDQVEETVHIKYGFKSNSDYLPCSFSQVGTKVYLWKAGVGKYGDIKLDLKDWLLLLKAMGSKILFDQWSEKIKQAA